jgi:hypothetical protein
MRTCRKAEENQGNRGRNWRKDMPKAKGIVKWMTSRRVWKGFETDSDDKVLV